MIRTLRALFAFWVILTAYSCSLVPVRDDQVIKSPNDQREYAYRVLPNQLRVLLISDPDTDKAAASMDVFVGSGDDPFDRQGLAHFLEHMLFLGTEKYPLSGEYQEFINAHGGRHNAYTSFQNTNYFFDIEPEYFNDALDRFAQFFISPLFDEQYVEREMNAVHSEFSSSLTHDGRRELDVLKELINPQHPFAKFSVGNLSTLSGGDTNTRDDLLDFYSKHYSANEMTLVVLSNESIESMEEQVRTHFSAVENREVNKSPIEEPLFTAGSLPLRVEIQPEQDIRELTLMFPLPSVEEYYKEKPLDYLGNILGHEGKGSLLSLLKSRGWAESLYAGTAIVYEGGASFQLGVTLTDEGLEHVNDITGLVFQALDRVRLVGLNKWRYQEQKALADIGFQFREKGQPISYVMGLSSNLHKYEARDVVRAPFLMTRYDAPLISRYLDAMTPDNVLITLVAKKSEERARKSVWYKTPYSVIQLDTSEVDSWKRKMSGQSILVPSPNPFIPRELALKSKLKELKKETPIPMDLASGLRVWHKLDDKFSVPRAGMYLNLKSPVASDSPINAVLTILYAELVTDQLKELTYPATLAGLDFSIRKNARGISLKIQGFDDRQSDLLRQILGVMVKPAYDPARFENRKKELMRAWANAAKQTPYRQLLKEVSGTLYTPSWSESELLAAAEPLIRDDLASFTPLLFSNMQAEMLYFGNITKEEARQAARLITDYFPLLQSQAEDTIPPVYVAKLAGQQRLVREILVEHPDAALVYYLQGDSVSYSDRAMVSLAAQLLKTNFFQQLRTEQQLGYIVTSFAMPVYKVPGIAFVVQSPVANSVQLEVAVHDFLRNYADNLKAMSPEQFERQKQALVLRILEKPKSLAEQGGRYWQEIVLGYSDFDDRQQLAAAIRAISQSDWLAFYENIFLAVERRDLIIRTRHKQQLDERYDERQLKMINNLQPFKSSASYYTFE